MAEESANGQSEEGQSVKKSTLKVVALVALLYVPVAAVISLVVMPYYRNNIGP